MSFENVLAPGRYEPLANLAHAGEGHDLMDRWESQLSIMIRGLRASGGIVDVDHSWTIEHGTADAPPARVESTA